MSVESVVPLLSGASSRSVLLAAALCSREENADPIDRAMIQGREKYEAGGEQERGQDETLLPGEGVHAEIQQEPLDLHQLLPSSDPTAYEMLKFTPFDSSTRRTEALLRTSDGQVLRVTKGAVATLALLAGISLDSPQYATIEGIVNANASRGFKTVAVGISAVDQEEGGRDHEADEREALLATASASSSHGHGHGHTATTGSMPGARLLGLVSLHDPPRADSAAVIQRLKELGIATKMLTGDSVGVARQMALQLNLGSEIINLEAEKQAVRQQWAAEGKLLASQQAVETTAGGATFKAHAAVPQSGAEEVRLTITSDAAAAVETPEQLEARLMAHLLSRFDPMSLSGFAQIFPADKHAIVQHAQRKNIVVGMTGDGSDAEPGGNNKRGSSGARC